MAGRPVYVVTDPATGESKIIPRGDGGAITPQEAAARAVGAVGEEKWQPLEPEQVKAMRERTRTAADVLKQARAIYRTEKLTPEQIRSVALRDPRAREIEAQIIAMEAAKRKVKEYTWEAAEKVFPEHYKKSEIERQISKRIIQPVKRRIALMKKQAPELYKRYETLLAKKIEEAGLTPERIKRAAEEISQAVPTLGGIEEYVPRAKKIERAFFETLIGAPARKPIKTAAMFALGYAIPPVVAVAKYPVVRYATPIIPKLPPVAYKAVTAVTGLGAAAIETLPVLYATGKLTQAIEAEEKEVGRFGEVMGEAISTEIIPMIVGGYYGAKRAMSVEMKTYLEKEIQRLPINQQQKTRDIIKQLTTLSEVRTPIRNVNFENIQNIPSRAGRIIKEFLLKNPNVIVGGSTSARAQLSKGIKTRTPKDLDFYSTNQAKLSRELVEVLKARGIKRVSMSPTTGSITIGGKSAIDWHDVETLKQNIQAVQPMLTSWKAGLTKTPEGMNILKLDMQARRKFVAGYLERLHPKDIKDLQTILKSYTKEARIGAREKIFVEPRLKKIKEIEKGLMPFFKVTPKMPPPLPKVTLDVTKLPLYKPIYPKYPKYAPYISAITIKPYKPTYKPPYKPPLIPKPIYAPQVIPKPKPIVPYKPPKEVPYKPIPIMETVYAPPTKPPERPIYVPPKRPPYKPPYKPPITPYVPPPAKPPRKPPPKILQVIKKLKKAQEFQTFVKIKGEFVKVGKPGLKQQAIKLGAEFVGEESLAATFLVKPTGKLIAGKELPFVPSPQVFRAYRKIRGRRIPLKDIWIEKRRFRLGAREVELIQKARADAFFGKQSRSRRSSPRRRNMGTNMLGANMFLK